MKKLSLIAALIVGAGLAYGDVLYWMVGDDYVDGAKAQGSETAATLYYVYNGGAAQYLDSVTGNDVDDYYPGSFDTALTVGTNAGDGYSYFVELWNHERTQTMDYATAKRNGYILSPGMSTPTPTSQAGFGGGSTTYAVPEPTSGLLFLVGGVLLGLKRRRQKV